MRIHAKKILAYILIITTLMGNTMSVSATGLDTGISENISTEIISEEVVEVSEEASSEAVVFEDVSEEEISVETSVEESVEEPTGEVSTEELESTEETVPTTESEEVTESNTEETEETEIITTEETSTEETLTAEEETTEEITTEEITTEEMTTEAFTVEAMDAMGEGVGAGNVTLLVSQAEDEFSVVDTYISLQDAFNAIDKLGEAKNFYRVELNSAEENIVTSLKKTITFPSKTAGLTIAAGEEQEETEIFFKGNITLKSDVEFENIIFVPASKATLSLGKYSLTLDNCAVNDRYAPGFGAVSGSGINKGSELILDDTQLTVFGAVNNVENLAFAGTDIEITDIEEQISDVPVLTAQGKINVGNVILESDAVLNGIATVTRKNGRITKVTPQTTINGEVISEKGKTLYLDLYEKLSAGYTQLNLDKDEAEEIGKTGLNIAKAVKVSYPDIKALQRNEEECLIKNAGYLAYYAPAYGAILSFNDGEKEVVISCRTFLDAVTEINNRKVKRDYVITLTEDSAAASGVRQDMLATAPKALSMPNKNYVSSLLIQADPALEGEKTAQLGFTGNITFTSDVTLRNVELVQMTKSGSTYLTADVAKDEHPSAVTIKTGGFSLAIDGKVTINAPVALNGGNKGSLNFAKGSTFTTLTNDREKPQTDDVNVIYGSVTGFNNINIEGCDLLISEYRTSRTGSYKASANKITNLNLKDAKLDIAGDNTVASLTVKNLNMENAQVYVSGKLGITNATLEGTQKAQIFADRDFTISGTLTSKSNNATLLTRLRGKGKAPYLTINGNVVREKGIKPIYVGVYNWDSASAAIRDDAVVLTNAPKVSAQLLTASKALAVDFRPMAENYAAGSGEYHKDNTSGYMMMKSGKNVYVYEGSKVKVAVYAKHDAQEEGKGELFGFFPSIKEASAAVNTKKDRTAYYTYVLMEVNGTTSSPVTMSLPSYAKQVIVTSLPDCDAEMKTITFSGNISMGADTVFDDIIFAPVSKGKGAAFTIAAGSKNLTLKDVSVSEELPKSALKDITGNGKQTVTLDSKDLQLTGSVTNAASLVVKETTQIKGNVKTTLLRLENNESSEAVTLSARGTVKVTNIENAGEKQNALSYTRNSKNITNLTINGYITNEAPEKPLVLKQDETVKSALPYQSGIRMVLGNAANLAVMPKASTDTFVIEAAVSDRPLQQYTDATALRLTKANKGIYLIDTTENTLQGEGVRLLAQSLAGVTTTYCMDYAQAVNEINNRADKAAEYTICLPAVDTEEGIDTVLTDTKSYGTFALPKKNTKASLIVKPEAENTVSVPFTGGIAGYGNVTLQNIVLVPVKSATNASSVNFKLTANADATGTKFVLDNVTTKEQLLNEQTKSGYISNIAGTKNKTEITLLDCGEMPIASGITNVKTLSLENTRLLSAKNSTVTGLLLDENSAWISLGQLTLTNVTVPEGVNSSFVGVKQDKKQNPQFALNGSVTGGRLQLRLYETATSVSDGMALFDVQQEREIDTYLNVPLVLAKKAEPDMIRAYAYRVIDENGTIANNADGVNKDNFAAYKEGNYIKNGTQETMLLSVNSDELQQMAQEAKEELKELAEEKILYALIYMADSYNVKEKACHESDTVATLQSGHTVQILGMEVEWTYSSQWEEYLPTVWYHVQFYIGETLYTGYVEESFLAYSDELLLEWKNNWSMLFPFDNTMYAAITSYSDVEKFPTSYQVHLKKLKDKYPNWTFVPMNVGRDWDDCVDEQMGNYSWIYYDQPEKFRGAKINSKWYYATREGIAYYMDPRNFLTESNIFQFEQNTYNSSYHTQSALQTFLNGTFMAGKVPDDSQGRTYAKVIWESGRDRGLSPFNLAARVIQEQGVKGTSAMISGTYPGYVGYFNHYNIQASGTTDEQVIKSGLAYAMKKGWNTRVLSLEGGANFIGNGYILKGQDTLYLQKFDIEHFEYGRDSDELHQYMQNIMAPYTEGRSMKSMYTEAGSLNSNFVFKIPVFDDMPGADYSISPKSARIEKGKTKQLTLMCDGVKIAANKATYSSEDVYVATVSSSGLITAVHSGNTVIKVKITDGKDTIELKCKVEVYAPLKSISLSVAEDELYVEDGLPDKVPVLMDGVTKYLDKKDCPTQTTLTVTYNPEDTTDSRKVKWTVENPEIVEVVQDASDVAKALVTAKKGGTTTITATVGKYTSSVIVNVRIPMTEASLKLNEDTLTLYKGQKTRVNISYAPYETTDFIDPEWSSSNESVVKVVDGEFVAVGKGTATLSANVGPFVGSQSGVTGLSCKVTVKEYTVTFKNTDGSTLYTTTGEYGSSLENLANADKIPWNIQKNGYVFAGWYTEADGKGFAVDKKNLLHGDMILYPYFIDATTGFYAKPIGDIEYTGAYLKPEVEVYSGDKLLEYGKDYTVVYLNNKSVNDQSVNELQPQAVVHGRGSYSGEEPYKVQFNIVPKDISHSDVTAKNLLNAYTGKEQQMRPVLYDGGRILQRDIDYTLSYFENDNESGSYSEPGTYAVEVNGTGNYSGSRIVYITISKRTLMTKVSVAAIADMKFNNGDKYESEGEIKVCEPKDIKVTYNGKPLIEGTDYTLEHVNNRNIGTASVIVTGIGDYIGTKTMSYRITGTAISTVTVKGMTDMEYTGDELQQDASKLKLTDKSGKILRKDLDYTLSYKNNIDAGRAVLSITGINGYSGVLTKSFKINPYNIVTNSEDCFEISMDDAVAEYDKSGNVKGIKGVKATFKGKVLTEGKDYMVTCKFYAETPDSCIVNITGIGNFTGTKQKVFELIN